jgi:hypothetical protein
MDYRNELRFDANQPVRVTNLGIPGEPVAGKIVNFSARGLRLLLMDEIAVGAVIKVEWGRTLLLGQVVYCEPEGKDFAAGMELEEAVYDTQMFASQTGAGAELPQTPKSS